MDPNKKAVSLYAGALFSFIIAALFQYVIGWGVSVFVTLSALNLLYCVTEQQALGRNVGGGFRAVLFVIALIAGGVFGLLFMSWTLLLIYLAAITAVTLLAIARA